MRPFTRLSDEVSLMILRRALLPCWVIDYVNPPSMAPFCNSAACADLYTKRTITEVCRTWHDLGVALLYEKVTLRRLDQLPALIWALEARESLCPLVRGLEITFLAPVFFFNDHESDIHKIFEMCPRLSHFGFFPANWPEEDSYHRLLPPTSCSITSLALRGPNLPGSLRQPMLIQHCRTLQHLSLGLPGPPPPINIHGNFNRLYHLSSGRKIKEVENPPLLFDNLEVLHITLMASSVLPAIWSMPRLQRVSLRGLANIRTASMLAPVGATITSLSISNLRFETQAAAAQMHIIQGILDSCSGLEHLALSASLFTPELHHATIVAVDVFCLFDSDVPQGASLRTLYTRFPMLQTVRTLHESMSVLRDIPRHSIEFMRPSQWAAGTLEADSDPPGPESAWIAAL
ncbi:hypothetical protein B0H16DRAFT_1889909 [Mycena metata]|uniref:Uncharacterized protein n=1 Tax=Mycena metata TaxID=1033252 RepID=A0AAD7N2L5_9AGAR|nr:hypothetical protein B0H16DRAFT_1889909 [Mycena metata]